MLSERRTLTNCSLGELRKGRMEFKELVAAGSCTTEFLKGRSYIEKVFRNLPSVPLESLLNSRL